MRARLVGAGAATLALVAGAQWWGALAAATIFQLPGRLAAALGAAAVLASLAPATGDSWRAVPAFAAGTLAAWAALLRLAPRVPWVAVPSYVAAALGLAVLWPVLPPAGFWVDSDVAARARILALACLALLGAALYGARYRNVPDAAGGDGGGTGGAREETR
ncbi:MAG TPA: hypothetical protein VHI93_08955 [Candidatus Thermoplasmatota archaeon]|nr:hypothetical protein [Candidatus Thermoplasmatota archaeon]